MANFVSELPPEVPLARYLYEARFECMFELENNVVLVTIAQYVSTQAVVDEDRFIGMISMFPPTLTSVPSPGLGSRDSKILLHRLNMIVLLLYYTQKIISYQYKPAPY